MKLRNLIFALFLVIGAIGFVSCTGDDGEAGPAGPAGPAGEKGDSGDSGSASGFYDFMMSWGSPTGEVACNSPLLTGEGSFPGPALEDIDDDAREDDEDTTDVNEASLNSPVVAMCAPTLFADTDEIDLGGDTPQAIDGNNSSIVLWKAGTAVEEDAAVPKEADDFGDATSTVETRNFVGGPLFATLMNNGPDEAIEREFLHTQCGLGTDPPQVAGEWKAVKKTSSVTTYTNRAPTPSTNDAPNPADTITLLKLCVVLDAHPGVTKCFVKETTAAGTTMQIALYDGENLHTVLAGDNENFPETVPDTGDQDQFLFGGGVAGDFEEVEALCALFGTS
jgi:hypothetical protein